MVLPVQFELLGGAFCGKELGNAEFPRLAFAFTVIVIESTIIICLSLRSASQLLSFSLFPFHFSLLGLLRDCVLTLDDGKSKIEQEERADKDHRHEEEESPRGVGFHIHDHDV